jgi:hypothetical protein
MFNLITLPLIVMIVLVSLSLVTNTRIYSISSSSTLYTPLQASAFIGMASAATATTTTGGDNFLTYSDPILGIRIDYPSGWTQELEGGGLVTFIASLESDSNTYPAAVGIKVQNLASSKNISLNEVTKIQIKNLKQSHPDFKLIESTESVLAGNNMAHKIVFTATDDREHQRKAMQIWTLKGDKAYLITYKAEPEKYSKYLPTIQKMIDSFQIIK